jgi:putative ABC transport system ATP-binding protein
MSEPVMEARDVVKFLGEGAGKVQALKGVDLTLRSGELALLMGPSGSGKTTLLSVLGCILSPSEGVVRVCGKPTTNLGPEQLAKLRREHIGFVFQSYHLFPTLTALDNVRLALDVRRAFRQSRSALERRTRARRSRSQNLWVSARTERRRTTASGDRARLGRRRSRDSGG